MVRSVEFEVGGSEGRQVPVQIAAATKSRILERAREQGKSLQLLLSQSIEIFCDGSALVLRSETRRVADVNRVQMNVRLSDCLDDRFAAKCEKWKVSKSWVIRQIIDDILSSPAS